MEVSRRDYTTFLGVDLGGGKGKNTAVARLETNGEAGVSVVYVSTKTPPPSSEPFYDPQLVSYIRDHVHEGALLAIDAPLSPSVCLRCQLEECVSLQTCDDPVVRWFREKGNDLVTGGNGRSRAKPATTAYTQRACEVVLHKRYGILPRETLGQGMGPLTARAHYLRRALGPTFELNANLIEVYPKATIYALFGERPAKRYKREVGTWRTRAKILEALGHELSFDVWREGCLQNDHCFDAVISAYTGYLWAKQGWSLPVNDRAIFEEDGWIWFPPMEPLR
jgi:predicted nuclease with RNAse H fold